MALLLKIHPDNPAERQMRTVVECLRDGGIVVYPTDTIYGMGCDIFRSRTVEKICELRGINPGKATFSFICSDLSQLADYCRPIENPIFKVMKANLPGPFTFILNASNNVPKHIQSKRRTVGIRIPDHPITLELVRMFGNPLMSTSVHDEDEILEYTTDPELIYEKFGQKIDLVIDAGIGGNIPSTVLDCTDGEVTLIREGKGELRY
jgi:tRNA threonylcarbamoyl adenosine modification protein (Sua5/YciO/YrdC/YwlC family)